MADELMKTAEVMEYLKISRSTIYRFMKEGKLRPYPLGPKSLRFRRAEVEALLRRGEGGGGDGQ